MHTTETFTAVRTTGIYCRPGCPGTPLRRNTTPYPYAAAAEAAGYRPCLRCRPDLVPEPGWIDAPELVRRALRCISDGALDGATEDTLAAQLGVSPRHLRRMFDTHVGATPSEVARSRRAHFARRLLDDTDLSIADVGFAAGFTSVRQMNRVMKDVFRFTPQELRARRRRADRNVVDGGLDLRLPFRPPLAWDALLAFLAPRAIPGVETVDLVTATYRRTVEIAAAPAVIEVTAKEGEPFLRMRAHLPLYSELVHLVAAVRRVFDLDADPGTIDVHLARDPRLRPLVKARPGLRVPGGVDRFEIGVRAVLGQQVTVAGATKLAGRLVEAHGTPVPGLEHLGLTHLFPTPETVAGADPAAFGLPAARGRALVHFGAAVAGGSVTLDPTNTEAGLVEALCALTGIGDWTAQYVAMRAGGARDAFPASDLGLRRALGPPGAPASVAEVLEQSQRWRPWRAYAALHLWTALGAGPGSTQSEK